MSQSTLNTTTPVPAPGADAPAQLPRQAAGQPAAASQDQVLSWEAALGRAEHGAAHAGATPGSSAPTGQEWSPMNPHGAPAGGEGAAMAGARDTAGACGTLQAPTGSGAEAQALVPPGAGAEPSTHMSPEELLQRQWDRIAMGLEPTAAPPGEGLDETAAGGWAAGAEAQPGSGLAQPVTWAQPVAVGWQSLPVNERPVADGMTTDELVSERHVEQERSDDQAYEAQGAVAAEQARLTEVNTPETLPERTIESV